GMDGEAVAGRIDLQALRLDGSQMLTPGDEHHILASLRQFGAEISARPTRAIYRNSHSCLHLPNAARTTAILHALRALSSPSPLDQHCGWLTARIRARYTQDARRYVGAT